MKIRGIGMKKSTANLSYCLIHASMWGMYAVIIYFANDFLKAQGLSGGMCSLVLGITAAASVLLNIGVSELIKRTQKVKLYVTTMLLAALILHEQFTAKSVIGCILIGAGTLLMVL